MFVLAVWLFTAVGASTAQADKREQARSLFEEAAELVDSGDLQAALERYRAAYELAPRPKILYNIALVLDHLGRLPDAAEAYDEYLRRHPADEATRVAKVRRRLAELDRDLGAVELEVAHARAEVRLDGRVLGVGRGVYRARVVPGEHVLIVENALDTERDRTLNIAAGQLLRIAIAAEPLPPGQPLTTSVSDDASPRWLAFVRADVDAMGRGAVTAPGAGVRVAGPAYVLANALVGRASGFEVALLLSGGRQWRPRAMLAMPVFFADGPRPLVRGALGLERRFSRAIGITVDAGVGRLLRATDDFLTTAFVVSFGLQVTR